MNLKLFRFFTLMQVFTVGQTLNSQINDDELKSLVSQTRQKFGLPAIAVIITNSNKILNYEIQGVRVQNTKNEVESADFFHIGSCSKSVLAVIAAKLIEQNKIYWNTRFFEVYPELRSVALKDYYEITLEDLFLCKAGIKGFTDTTDVFPEVDRSKGEIRYQFAEWLFKQKPSSNFKNGKFDFRYSNAGYTLAGLMLEKVSGMKYSELIDHYFDKAFGTETFIGFPNRISADQPWGHLINKTNVEIYPPYHEYHIPDLITPAGDLSMKPEDFAKYIRLSLSGLRGVDNFLTSESYKYIHYAHKGFSVGVFNSKMSGYQFSGMDGSAGTFFCRAILVPESDFAFIIMTNSGSGSGRMRPIDWLTMKIVKKYYKLWWKFWL